MPQVKVRNILDTVTSFLQHASTTVRTWTIPDKDGTFAMLDDIPSTPIENETPSGAINGINTAYTLANVPVVGSVKLYLGLRLKEGVDYTITGANITMLFAPETGQQLISDYRI